MAKKGEIRAEARMLRRRLRTHPELFAHLADCELQAGRLKRAGKLLQEGLQRFPNYAPGWIVQGNYLSRLKQFRQARVAYEEALARVENLPYAHERCAELAGQEGDWDAQIRHLQALRELAPLDGDVQVAFQTLVMRKIGVEHGLFSVREAERMMPEALRRVLRNNNLLPMDLERRQPRPEEASPAVVQETQPPEPKPVELPEELVVVDEAADRLEPESFQALLEELERSVDSSRYPLGRFELEQLKEKATRVSWGDAVATPGQSPIREASPVEERGEPPEAAAPKEAKEDKEVSPSALEPEAARETVVHESPLMKLLRGEMLERRIPRDIGIQGKEPQGFKPPRGEVQPSAREEVKAPEGGGVKSREVKEPSEPAREALSGETSQRHTPVFFSLEGLRSKAQSPTGAPPEGGVEGAPPAPTPAAEPPQAAGRVRGVATVSLGEQMAEMAGVPPKGEVGAEVPSELGELAREVTGVPPRPTPPPPRAAEPPGDRIATKTLAELYASQGQWAKAIAVYEQLLLKHPDNQAYKQRLQELRRRMESE